MSRPIDPSGPTEQRESTMIRKLVCGAGALGSSLLAATTAFAQEVAVTAATAATPEAAAAAAPTTDLIKAPTVEQMAGMVDKGDTAWMLISSVLVLMMSIPALALFYGGPGAALPALSAWQAPSWTAPSPAWPARVPITRAQ